MLEQPVSEIFRYLFGMILMCFILSVAIFVTKFKKSIRSANKSTIGSSAEGLD